MGCNLRFSAKANGKFSWEFDVIKQDFHSTHKLCRIEVLSAKKWSKNAALWKATDDSDSI